MRFFQWKTPFSQKNTSFNIENEVLSQNRVLYIGNSILQWKPQFSQRQTSRKSVFSGGKHRFVRRIQVLTSKTRFYHRIGYFTSEIVFYSRNLSFLREKSSRKSVFSGGKSPFCQKNTSFNIENEILSQKRVLYI